MVSPLRRDLYYYTGGFLRNRRVRRILDLSGFNLRLGVPRAQSEDAVVVWGRTARVRRGQAVATRRGVSLMTCEDAPLRSVLTGRSGADPLGLVCDTKGIYFDTTKPSDLENILNYGALTGAKTLARASDAMTRIKQLHLSKYNAHDPDLAPPCRDYILLIDQTKDDASIRLGGADGDTFRQMLDAARAENPGKTILIKTHPEVRAGLRSGHFSRDDLDDNTLLVDAPLSPWTLFEGALKIYCVTSLMGFEAIIAGHRPHVFGRPFYAGWGRSKDRQKMSRRARGLSARALFAGVMFKYATWYDPYRDRLCQVEDVIAALQAQTRAWREDHKGYDAIGMRLWKRTHLRRFFAAPGASVKFFTTDVKTKRHDCTLVWAGAVPAHRKDADITRLEDGFLRSRGLGAALVPPLSLVADDLGIYYDPTRESRFERLLNAQTLDDFDRDRAHALREYLISKGLSKYNLGQEADTADWPGNRTRILVPGQVEDDASIRLGAGAISTNAGLLARTRAENPDAFIIYKPHPDVEAGLRQGGVHADAALEWADVIAKDAGPAALINAADALWTMTSLMGFEALLRGKPVTCLGAPFYSSWGLTMDLGPKVARRTARPDLDSLVFATLIAYPRYFDPQTGLACPPEVVAERLDTGQIQQPGAANRVLSKIQGAFAGYAHLWRRSSYW